VYTTNYTTPHQPVHPPRKSFPKLQEWKGFEYAREKQLTEDMAGRVASLQDEWAHSDRMFSLRERSLSSAGVEEVNRSSQELHRAVELRVDASMDDTFADQSAKLRVVGLAAGV
jgi:hypothetical protein